MPNKEDNKTKSYIPFKQWYKMLKKAIKIAETKEELDTIYSRAIENQKHFSRGQGQLVEDMIKLKYKEV